MLELKYYGSTFSCYSVSSNSLNVKSGSEGSRRTSAIHLWPYKTPTSLADTYAVYGMLYIWNKKRYYVQLTDS